MSTAVATFSPTVPTDSVTTRTVTWSVLPGGTGAPVVTTHSLAASVTTDSLPCNPGDVVSFFVVDTNSVGSSSPSNTLTQTDPTPGPTAVPTTPVALTLTFTNP
jgi:hypothetical protein